MKTIQLSGTIRSQFGKKSAKDIRREQRIPCAIYGSNGRTILFSVDAKEVKPLIYTPSSYIVELDIDGTKERGVMREVQYHPTKDYPMHIDFFRVSADKAVAIDIPVRLTGNSEGVKAGGKLVLKKRKLRVSGLVENLPDELVIDVTELGIGKVTTVGDLQYEGLAMLNPASMTVCTVLSTRAARADQPAE